MNSECKSAIKRASEEVWKRIELAPAERGTEDNPVEKALGRLFTPKFPR
ncbi:MAG TPA: hypothetical protein VND40_05895 [Nitrososphaerales archaeon]|nr:hypothetical protein [Nitrososphaerales archaeon]